MFYYGLDFHDLASDSLLHISTVIVVCEAFLRITPHFGLWLKTFNVKPKMIEGQHAACRGASIRKNADAPWPEGCFLEVSGLWQREWFYITAPPNCQVGSFPHLLLRPATTTDVMDQQGAELGSSQGRANTAKPYPRSL